MKSPTKITLGRGAKLDVQTLVDTRMLLAGSSGSGKSYLMRVLAEQVVQQVQTIVIDPEGEYTTLREKHDLVIVGEDGELAPTVPTAAKLARRLLELQVSAVVDIYAMKLPDRRAFVRHFIDSMMSAPKKLWRPCFVMLDEAHRFCPERGAGQAESTDAVITLLSQGRKRGYCGILATQRLQKLHKDAAAETLNNLIGRTTLDVDVKRARDILGLHKGDESQLRSLKPGNWFGFGPAFVEADGVTQFAGAKAKTTHPQAGKRHRIQAPGPSARIQKVVAELSEIPAQIKEEEEVEAQLRREIRELKSKLSAANAAAKTGHAKRVPDQKAIDKAVDEAVQRALGRLHRAVGKASKEAHQKLSKVVRSAQAVLDGLSSVEESICAPVLMEKVPSSAIEGKRMSAIPATKGTPKAQRARPVVVEHDSSLPFSWRSAPGKVLTVILQHHPEVLTPRRIAAIAGVNVRSSTFRNAMSKLRTSGLVDDFAATEYGMQFAGDVEPLPSGPDMIAEWASRLGNGVPRLLFDAMCEYGGKIHKHDAAHECNVDQGSSTFRNAISKLRTLGLIERSKGQELELSGHVLQALN